MAAAGLAGFRPEAAMTSEGLADALKARTGPLHREAERTGLVAALVRGEASLAGYTLWLRNLYPVYRVLEWSLERHCQAAGVGRVVRPDLYRAAALAADLGALVGRGWRRLPLLPEGRRYARRLAEAGRHAPPRLVPHAYTRYLGDLNGGRVLRRRLVEGLGLPAACLGFYEFPEPAQPPALAVAYRRAIDAAGEEVADWEGLLAEAEVAFRCNIQLSVAVADRIRSNGAGGSGSPFVGAATAVGVAQ